MTGSIQPRPTLTYRRSLILLIQAVNAVIAAERALVGLNDLPERNFSDVLALREWAANQLREAAARTD